MKMTLLTWNPEKWHWEKLQEHIQNIEEAGASNMRWSCGGNKSIEPGDRVFLIRLGKSPKGIVGSGISKSKVFQGPAWSEEEGKISNYIHVEFDTILDAESEEIFGIEALKKYLPSQNWSPQSGGNWIRSELVFELEKMWLEHSTNNKSIVMAPQTVHTNKEYFEGRLTEVKSKRYERNIYAKQACLSHYGYSCKVCGLDFERNYGEIGIKHIHVHHLTPISDIPVVRRIDPIADLIPVCPNCHSLLHKKNPPYSPEEMKLIMESKKVSNNH